MKSDKRTKLKKGRMYAVFTVVTFVVLLLSGVSGACKPPGEEYGRIEFQSAVRNGDAEAVRKLIESGANIRSDFMYHTYAIHVASYLDYSEVVNILIENDADVNIISGSGNYSPLHWAARNGSIEAALILIENGADVNAKSRGGKNLLCSETWSLRDVKTALGESRMRCGNGQDVDYEAMYKIARSAELLQAARDCAEGMVPIYNAYAPAAPVPFNIRQVLDMLGEKEAITQLVDEGIDIEKNWGNGCPYSDSISISSPGTTFPVENLLEYSLYQSAIDDRGYTPLHWASGNGHEEMVELLIEAGADVNAKSLNGVTPLSLAILTNNTSVSEILKAHGAVEPGIIE